MTPLPQLVDRKTLAEETGLPRSAVDAIFREVEVIRLPGLPRKPFVRRSDVERLLHEGTTRRGECEAA